MRKFLPRFSFFPFLPPIFCVYWLTLAPDLVWDPPETGTLLASIQDPEFFNLSASPLYFLLAQIWKIIPWGTLAFRGNIVSAISVLSGVVVVYFLILKLVQDLKFAVLAEFMVAFLPLLWSFALYANFYTLLFFLSLLYLFFLVFDEEGKKPFIVALILGFAISTAPAAAVLFLPLLFYLWIGRHHLGIKGLGLVIMGVLVGLTPAFLSAIFFGIPLVKIFSSLKPLSPFLSSLWQNIFSFAELFLQIFWPFFPLAFIGAFWGVRGKRGIFLILGFLSALILFGIYSLPRDLGLYLFPISVFIIWSVLGARVVWELIATLSDTEIGAVFENRLFVLVFRLKRKVAMLRYLFMGFFLLFLLFLPYKELQTSFVTLDRGSDKEALDYGLKAWERLSEDSLVLAQREEFLSSLRYFSSLEKEKRVIVTTTSLAFIADERARLRKFYPELKIPAVVKIAPTLDEGAKALRFFVEANLDNFDIFLTLDHPSRGEGVVFGRWEEYSLISEEPLYKLAK